MWTIDGPRKRLLLERVHCATNAPHRCRDCNFRSAAMARPGPARLGAADAQGLSFNHRRRRQRARHGKRDCATRCDACAASTKRRKVRQVPRGQRSGSPRARAWLRPPAFHGWRLPASGGPARAAPMGDAARALRRRRRGAALSRNVGRAQPGHYRERRFRARWGRRQDALCAAASARPRHRRALDPSHAFQRWQYFLLPFRFHSSQWL